MVPVYEVISSLRETMTDQERRRIRAAGISTAPTKHGTRLRQRMVMTWAALAGIAAAAAVSTMLGDGGWIARLLGNRDGTMVAMNLPPEAMPAADGSPMATGSTGNPKSAVMADIATLKAEITRLQTAVRRGEIEKKALLKRIAELRGDGPDPIRDIVTGSLPRSAAGWNAPGSGITATSTAMSDEINPVRAQAPDVRMHEAMSKSMAAEFAYAQTKITNTQFAVEVAAAQSLSALRRQWDGISNSHPSLLKDFDPVVNVREDARGLSLHLLAGPVSNAADAIDICAQLRGTGTVCAAVPYDGQRLLGGN